MSSSRRALSAANSHRVEAGTGSAVTVRVRHDEARGALYFMACDARACSRVGVSGSTPAGEPRYETRYDCNKLGIGGCTRLQDVS